jgi:hypothetical protein
MNSGNGWLGSGALSMGVVSVTLEPDEEQGLRAITAVAAARRGAEADPAEEAQSLLHVAIATRLEELGLTWAPSPESVALRVREAARPAGRLAAFLRTDRVRRAAVSAFAVAVLVVLWGGYVQHWQWTGFPGNEQLWDWLHLLLLPAAIASARLLPSILGRLRPAYQWGATGLVLVWALTIVGGYAWRWMWTGYQGNTLWDWLQLLLLPFVVPVFLLPAALGWMSDNAPSGGASSHVKAAAR